MNVSNEIHPLRRLFRYSKKYKSNIYRASTYSVVNKLFDIAPEALIGVAVDVVVNRQNSFLAKIGIVDVMHQLTWLAVVTFFIWFFESLFEYLYSLEWRGLAQTLQHELRLDTYSHLQKLDMAFFERQSTGRLTSILSDDVNQLDRFLDGGANSIIQVTVSVVVIGAIFVYISPLIAFFAILPMPFILFGAFRFQKKLAPLYQNVRTHAGTISSLLTNNIPGIMTIKSYTAEAHESSRLESASINYQSANAHSIKVSSAFIPIIRMAILAGFLFTLVLGGWLTLQGKLQVGSYSILVFLTQRLLWPLTGLAQTVDLFERAMASTRNVLNLLDTQIQIPSGSHILTPDGAKQNIQFSHTEFGYDGRPNIITDVSLTIKGGSHTAFVGATGSGKSTLMKLLMRFYEPVSGSIMIGEQPLSGLNLESLRRHVGYVSQDVFLVNGTIADNICYGSFGSSREAIVHAAKQAEAHDFIEQLPQGYDALVGERGVLLSGGQRQRLAIARALLKNPEILILDEATSAVDNETEAAIQRSLKSIVVGRTTVSIAHRLSTIRNADLICVMNEGRIVESGTHEQLVALDRQYAALWRIQTGG